MINLYREYGLHLDVMEKGLIEEDVPQQGANSNWLYRTKMSKIGCRPNEEIDIRMN